MNTSDDYSFEIGSLVRIREMHELPKHYRWRHYDFVPDYSNVPLVVFGEEYINQFYTYCPGDILRVRVKPSWRHKKKYSQGTDFLLYRWRMIWYNCDRPVRMLSQQPRAILFDV